MKNQHHNWKLDRDQYGTRTGFIRCTKCRGLKRVGMNPPCAGKVARGPSSRAGQ